MVAPPTSSSQPPPRPAPAAAFEFLLAHAARGNALWRPVAHSGLGSSSGSGSVGDCGYFRDGSFIKLFNVFGPPLGLPMLQLDSGDVQRHSLPNTSVLMSSTRSKIVLSRGVPVGPPPHTVTGSFELAAEEPACAFLAFGGHSRVVDAGPTQKLARYLVEHRRRIFERYRASDDDNNNMPADLDEDALVILHETTKAGAWLGGVAYPLGAVAGSFTLDGAGARVSVLTPRDPAALKHAASVRWEFTYGRSDGPSPTCCIVAKAVVTRSRRRSRPPARNRSSTWSSISPSPTTSVSMSPSSSRTSSSAWSASTRSRSSTWSKGSGSSMSSLSSAPTSGRRLSVRALAEWNKINPAAPMTEDDLEIHSPVVMSPEEATPARLEPPPEVEEEPEVEHERTLLERLLDNVLNEYPNIDLAVGDWSCIIEYEERHGRLPSADVVPAFKALHTWVTGDGVHAAYLSHIPPQAASLGFIDLRAYTTTIRARTSSLSDPRPLSVAPSPPRRTHPTQFASLGRKSSTEMLATASANAHSRKPSDTYSHMHPRPLAPPDAGRRLRADSVRAALSLPARRA